MLKKESILLMFLIIIREPAKIRTDNQIVNIIRDPIKVARLVEFKVGLNRTLFSLRNSIANATLLETIDDFLR